MRAIFNRFYKFYSFFWDISIGVEITAKDILGPFCPNCRGDLEFPKQVEEKYSGGTWAGRYKEYIGVMKCNHCANEFKLKKTINQYKNLVVTAYAVFKRSEAEVFSLDEPPTQLINRQEKGNFFLSTKIGQDKSGRTMGVIHMGEKKKDQEKEDYAQIFIDFQNEEVRADASNKFPGEIAKKIEVKFSRSKTQILYNNKRSKDNKKTKKK